MILDVVQAKRVGGLIDPCQKYCEGLIQADSSAKLSSFSAWLKDPKQNTAPECPADWAWLCDLMTRKQTPTHKNRGLIELLALALVMEAQTAADPVPLTDKQLKKLATQLAHVHSQFCVLQRAEELLKKPTGGPRERVQEDLWRLFQKNAVTQGVLQSAKPVKNAFNKTCEDCQDIFRKKLLNLQENEVSYHRILLDTYAQVLQLGAEDAAKLEEQRAAAAREPETIPAAFFQSIPGSKDKNRYAAAAVIWQMLSTSLVPEAGCFLRDYQLERYGVLPSLASVSGVMAQFGQMWPPAPKASETADPGAADVPFGYVRYDESSPALFVVRRDASWGKEQQLSAAFMARPDGGALFSLCAGLFFELYGELHTSTGPALPDEKTARQAVWAAFETLRTQFPQQAAKSQLTGASFEAFILFLTNYVKTAAYRDKLSGVLTGPDNSIDFAKLSQLLPDETTPEGSGVWQDFCSYWKDHANGDTGSGKQKKGEVAAQWKQAQEKGEAKGGKPKKKAKSQAAKH